MTITTEGLESQLQALKAATPDAASAGLQHWAEKARGAVETAAHATTPQQFNDAELVLANVIEAVAIVRGKVLATH
jgi:hypothetical protein